MEAVNDALLSVLNLKTIRLENKSILLINVCNNNQLSKFYNNKIYLYQNFFPYAQDLEKSGFFVHNYLPKNRDAVFDIALVMIPKNMIEAKYLMAKGIDLLADGGRIICAAGNKAGGLRLKKIMLDFGLDNVEQESVSKSKIVSAVKGINADEVRLSEAMRGGELQQVLAGAYISCSGIFGWDKIDQGSRMLAECLPDNLMGVGADFGCGYGYLSDKCLGKNKKIKYLYCIDADSRAVEASRLNLQKYMCGKKFIWADLSDQDSVKKLFNNLDFIIMNPPFHEGKITNINLGVSFIRNAYASLRKGGELWMVANRQLAYEAVLSDIFHHVDKLREEQGFKIFKATK